MLKLAHKKIFFLTSFLNEFARTLPHAVLTIILLSKGISVPEIALVQMFYMIAMVLCEFPSGVLSDKTDRTTVYFLSIVASAIAYIIIFFANSFPVLCIAWFVYGLAAALNTGTVDVSFSILLKDDESQLKKFFSELTIIVSVGAILGGLIVSLLYNEINNKIYIVSFILFSASGLITILFLPSGRSSSDENIISYKNLVSGLVLEIKQVLSAKKVIIIFLLLSALQLFSQPFFQYWQTIFLENNIDSSIFGLVYVAFRVATIVSAWLFKYIRHNYITSLYILTLVVISVIIINIINNPIIFMIMMSIILILVSLYNLNLDLFLKQNIDNNIMSTVISLNSTINRFFSMLVLLICSGLLKIFSSTAMFTILVVIFVLVSIVFNNLMKRDLPKNSIK